MTRTRPFLRTIPVLLTLGLGLLIALIAAGFATGLLESSAQGSLIPGDAHATTLSTSRRHLIGLAITAPIGLVVGLLALLTRGRVRFALQWVGVALLSGLATLPVLVIVHNPNGLLLTLPGALFSVLILYRLQRHRRIAIGAAAAAFVWGMTAAVSIGWVLQMLHRELVFGDVDAFTSVDPLWGTLSAPLWEELGKAAGVLVVYAYLKDRFDGVAGGLIVGALVGAGFNFAETIRFALRSFDTAAYQVWIREWVSGVFAGHIVFTALTGAAVGLAVTRRAAAKVPIVLAGFTLAVLGHLVWNLTVHLGTEPFASDDLATELLVNMPLNYLIVGAPFIVLVFGMLWAAQRREGQALRAVLPVEAGTGLGAVRAAEAPVLVSPLLRTAYRIHAARHYGPAAFFRARRLQLAQLDLAIERWKASQRPHRASRETYLRDRIAVLRARMYRLPAGVGDG